ncbi:MAG TPA: hypothetical protein V6D11_13260 [Waterburya sp.]
MAQPNPASEPIDNQLQRSPAQELEVNSKRSPAQEIDHIRNSDIYCPVQRDEALFKWFNSNEMPDVVAILKHSMVRICRKLVNFIE